MSAVLRDGGLAGQRALVLGGKVPDRQPLPRVGLPGDIASAAVALLTNPAITGAVLDVDGGERPGFWSGGAA